MTSLDLQGSNIGDEGATALAENTTLTSLALRGNRIGNEAIEATNRAITRNKLLPTIISDKLSRSRSPSAEPFILTDLERKHISNPANSLRVLKTFLEKNPELILNKETQDRIKEASLDGRRLLTVATAARMDDKVDPELKLTALRRLQATISDSLKVAGVAKNSFGAISGLPDGVQSEILGFAGSGAVKMNAGGAAEAGGGGGGGGGSGEGRPLPRVAEAGAAAAAPGEKKPRGK